MRIPTLQNRRRAANVLALALAIATLLTAGSPAPPPPLPELNEKVLAFARANLGQSVGNGSCNTLAIAALQAAGAKSHPILEPDGAIAWGQPVESFKEAMPGDILQFHNAVFRGRRTIGRRGWVTWHYEFAHHTAILARVSERGKVVVLLHQNVITGGKETKDSRNVQEGTLRMDSLQPGGWVRIYRPIALSAPNPPPAGDPPGSFAPGGSDPEP